MKTKNNVQKAITKTLAVIVSLVLISITVQAQDFWKNVLHNNSFNQIAMAMVSGNEASEMGNTDATDADVYTEYLAKEVEPAIDLEEWMINENNFFTTVSFEAVAENSLELENWMTNENFFDGTANWFVVETEATLELEEWMTNESSFGVKTVDLSVEKDTELQMEAWMTNKKIWKI